MLFQDKKGVSIMIGYILLITIAVIMGVLVYGWMRNYVPKEGLNCPEGVSLQITDYTYSCSNNLKLTIKNNGRFNVAGYFIYGTSSPEQELATINLAGYITDATLKTTKAGAVIAAPVGDSDNRIEPNHILLPNPNEFQWDISKLPKIYSVEIIPLRYQVEDNKKRIVSCDAAKIKQEFSCT